MPQGDCGNISAPIRLTLPVKLDGRLKTKHKLSSQLCQLIYPSTHSNDDNDISVSCDIHRESIMTDKYLWKGST